MSWCRKDIGGIFLYITYAFWTGIYNVWNYSLYVGEGLLRATCQVTPLHSLMAFAGIFLSMITFLSSMTVMEFVYVITLWH